MTNVTHSKHLRFAERLVAKHGDDVRYVHGMGWYVWDGARWARDLTGAATRLVVADLKTAYAELADLDRDSQRDLLRDIHSIEAKGGVDGVLHAASTMLPVAVTADDLDSHPHLINVPGGTYDLEAGRLRSHRRSDLLSKITRADPGDQNPIWEKFITEIQPDDETRRYLQRVVGVAMLGEQVEHILPILTGPAQNGKGTFKDAITHAFGDYAKEVDAVLLVETRSTRHGTYKMALKGQRIIFCDELDNGASFAQATVKKLTGGNHIQANYMHRDAIEFAPSHTLFLIANHLPSLDGSDPAMRRRIRVIPFDVHIAQPDNLLPKKLEEAAPAIIAWALEGWIDYVNRGRKLDEPDAVRLRTDAYMDANNTIGRFLSERTTRNPNASIKAADLYAAWASWCTEEDQDPGTATAFGKALTERGYAKKKTRTGKVYPGMMLYTEEST